MTTDTRSLPTLRHLVPCRACGSEIGLVQLGPDRWRAIDTKPWDHGEIFLLPDGERAVCHDDHPRLPAATWELYPGLRYISHSRTCSMRGTTTLGASLRDLLNDQPLTPAQQAKEARRQARLAEDRRRDARYLR